MRRHLRRQCGPEVSRNQNLKFAFFFRLLSEPELDAVLRYGKENWATNLAAYPSGWNTDISADHQQKSET